MTNNNNNLIIIFGDQPVRRVWDEKLEKWWFSVVDIINILTESENPQVYWRVMKKRLIDEGSGETVTKCNGLKMTAPDGKMRLTDVADVETVLRLIQSIPSPKAEPFKLWLAKVGYERMRETVDPELAVSRARKNWQGLGQQNLRDHMSEAELIFTALAELSTREIAEAEKAEGYDPNKSAAHEGGKISGGARKALESKTGKKVVTEENYLGQQDEKKKLK